MKHEDQTLLGMTFEDDEFKKLKDKIEKHDHENISISLRIKKDYY